MKVLYFFTVGGAGGAGGGDGRVVCVCEILA